MGNSPSPTKISRTWFIKTDDATYCLEHTHPKTMILFTADGKIRHVVHNMWVESDGPNIVYKFKLAGDITAQVVKSPVTGAIAFEYGGKSRVVLETNEPNLSRHLSYSNSRRVRH